VGEDADTLRCLMIVIVKDMRRKKVKQLSVSRSIILLYCAAAGSSSGHLEDSDVAPSTGDTRVDNVMLSACAGACACACARADWLLPNAAGASTSTSTSDMAPYK
jgi:hypothetical protein